LLRGIVGINKEEQEKQQDILLNITLFVDMSAAGLSDDIDDAINYRTLTKRIIRMVEASSFFLVERLAAEVVALCLTDPRVGAARVRVEKPGALRFARSVGVEIERTQEDLAALPNRVVVTLGSNIDPAANLQAAVAELRTYEAVSVIAVSPVYETAPVGTADQTSFLNAAVLIVTPQSVDALKSGVLQPVEQALGRVRTADKYAARTIDLDIALFNYEVLDARGHHIPDPDILSYPHVAVPIADVAPYYIHPETGQTLAAVARGLMTVRGIHSDTIMRRDDLVLS
jgi:2-amino-4-hydroxy-6-hydroxymethyldihydropteridine diphosphokinase